MTCKCNDLKKEQKVETQYINSLYSIGIFAQAVRPSAPGFV